MPHVATTDEKNVMRRARQASKLYLAVLHPKTVYTARLNGIPSSNDMVAQITYDGGSGTLANVKIDMTMYVGTSAGDWDLGLCRIRKTPTSTIFYIGEQSKIKWADNAYLTIVQDFDLWPKHLHITAGVAKIDYDISYTNQHSTCKPVPILGSHPVAKLVDGEIQVKFGPESGTASYCIGSTITGVQWTIPDAIAIDDNTSTNPLVTFDTPGTYVAYCEVTAANGAKKTGVRYAFIYDDDNPPTEVVALNDFEEDSESGGLIFGVDCRYDINLQDIRPGSMCVLFSIDYYNDEEIRLGVIDGQRNIKGVGRISNLESISYNYQTGIVSFTVEGYQESFRHITGFPYGVEMKNTPAVWTDMPGLTVRKAMWDLLENYCTATTIMDVILTNDARYAKELTAPISNLWQQMEQIAFATILANIHVDHLGRFFCKTDALLTPIADRDYVTVMEITKNDWKGDIGFDYRTESDVSMVDLSGINVSLSGDGIAYFSKSPGHIFDRTGEPEIVDRLLLSTQAKSNELAGLIFAERNNRYPTLRVELAGLYPLLTCFPEQAVQFIIQSGDTPRGIALDKKFIIRHRSLEYDNSKGILRSSLILEAETIPEIAINGDIPGGDDSPFPPDFPEFPEIPHPYPQLPGGGGEFDDAPAKVIIHDIGTLKHGLLYTSNFNSENPDWGQINGGLTTDQKDNINRMMVCPNGAVYVACMDHTVDGFLARAQYAGADFVILLDRDAMVELYEGSTDNVGLCAIGFNPLLAESVLIATSQAGENVKTFLGSGPDFDAFVPKVEITLNTNNKASISYGLNNWRFAASGRGLLLGPTAAAIISNEELGPVTLSRHIGATTSGRTIHWSDDSLTIGTALAIANNNFAAIVNNVAGDIDSSYNPEDRIVCDNTGMVVMARNASGPTPIRSTDGGFSFSVMAGLPPLVDIYYANPGDANRWVAVAGSVSPYYSPDAGSTWVSKAGNLITDFALVQLNAVKIIP